jgi:HlyD family secretion protein
MKRLIAFFVLLAVVGGGAYYYFVVNKPVEKPQVVYAAISQGDIVEAVQATGTLGPVERVDVGSQVSGQVQSVFVDFNDVVREGQLLAKIDPTLLETQVQINTANVERQKGDIANQEVQLEDLKVQLSRTQQMFERGLQNQQQLEQAQLAVKTRQAQIDSAKKSLIQAETNLEQAKLNVSYTNIKSPINGVVVDRLVDPGKTVQASMNSPQFFVLASDLATLKLTAGVDEAEIGRVRRGQQVVFQVDAYGTQEFYGTVDSVRLNASTQNNVVTYPVWITVQNPDYRLRPSMTASARIVISRAQNVVRVPNAALRFRPTNDMYLALGLTPPTPGQGRAGRGGEAGPPDASGGNSGNRGGAQGAGQPAQPPAGASGRQAGSGSGDTAAATPGTSGRGQGGTRQPGQGFGAQSGGQLDPEAMARVREQFGRGGGGAGGRGGRTGRGGRGGGNGMAVVPVSQAQIANAQKIDDLFAPLQRQIRPAQVWTWDETTKKLDRHDIRLGVDDGTFSELVSGSLQVGQQLVTGIILPQARTTTGSNSNLFNPQSGRGMGPGGFGGGDRGGGGGGGRGR